MIDRPPSFEASSYDSTGYADGVHTIHDSALEYTHYILFTEDSPHPVMETFVSDETRSFGLDQEFMLQEIARVRQDPFGENSVDPDLRSFYTSLEIQDRALSRSINRISQEAANSIGRPMVVKASHATVDQHLNFPTNTRGRHEDLTYQYLRMRELKQLERERLTSEQRQIIRFVNVYGAVEQSGMSYLFMEYIDGERIKEPPSYFGDIDTVESRWFSDANHGQLFAAFPKLRDFSEQEGGGRINFTLLMLRLALADQLGIDPKELDMASRNILVQEKVGDDGAVSKEYVIIDQNPHKNGNIPLYMP